jgi:hypothetical protein
MLLMPLIPLMLLTLRFELFADVAVTVDAVDTVVIADVVVPVTVDAIDAVVAGVGVVVAVAVVVVVDAAVVVVVVGEQGGSPCARASDQSEAETVTFEPIGSCLGRWSLTTFRLPILHTHSMDIVIHPIRSGSVCRDPDHGGDLKRVR